MVHYAETAACRRRELLQYFSESYPGENCGGCDNCLAPRDTYDGTVAAQKFLSCIYRVRQQSRLDFGINQIAEILTGGETEGIRKWNHDQLSTYGIGREHSRPEWKAIGRELVRMGFVRQSAEKFSTLSLTAEGMAMLKERRRVTLSKPVTAPEPQAHRVGEIACDEVLFESLRQLRKQLADERAVPPYIIFSDVSLRQMARNYPATEREFARISGVGERKLHEFGAAFLGAIEAHLRTHPRQMFADESFTADAPLPARARLGATAHDTLRRFRGGASVERIAFDRRLSAGTVYSHLAEGILAGERIDLDKLLEPEDQREIAAALHKTGLERLSAVFEALGGRYDYSRIKLVRAVLIRGANTPQPTGTRK
jgi:ATP-dependent DNA helicase RecQ